LCPHCYSWAFTWQKLAGSGTVASFVVVHQATPTFAEMTPYTIARIDLDGTDGDVRLTSNVAGTDVTVGQRVQVAFDEQGLPRFEPL
jgi:uncharacterized OB-fold protein